MPASSSHKSYSLALRLWHWGNAAVISGLLTTILFLFVIIKTKEVGPIFQEMLAKDGLEVTQQQARALRKVVSSRIWDWHITLGLILTGLLVFRVALEWLQPAGQRFATRLRSARAHFRRQGPDVRDTRHSLLVKWSYLVFYVLLGVMVGTGLVLVYADDVAFLHSIEHTCKEIHEVTMYLVIAFVVAHVVGVVWAEVTRNRGIVSDMINGGNQVEEV